MDAVTLIQEARLAGLVLIPEGDFLRVRGPKSAERLARCVLSMKAEVLAILQGSLLDATAALHQDHPLARFRWEDGVLAPGLCAPEPRHGIFHKRLDCTSRRSWRHVWGDFYCLDCWPPTDPLAVVG